MLLLQKQMQLAVCLLEPQCFGCPSLMLSDIYVCLTLWVILPALIASPLTQRRALGK